MHIEIWSDIACPWCYIGKRHFEEALASYPHADQVEIIWRSFELQPDAPLEQTALTVERLMEKYGMSRDKALENMQRVTDVAAAAGLEFHLDIARSSNTFDAHRLVHFAAEHDLGVAMMERFMQAYQMEGVYLADHGELTRLATEVGLDTEAVKGVLDSDRYADAVRADEQRAHQFGVNGVPFFVFDGTTGVSGAQPSAVFLQALTELGPKAAPLTMMAGGGDAAICDEDGCVVPQV